MIKKLQYKNFNYILSTPKDFNEDKKYPVIIFLHGAGSRGADIKLLEQNPYFLHMTKHGLDFVSFAPQCFANTWFDIFEQLQDFVDFAIAHKFADDSRIYLMGASMGGYGVWQLAMSRPELFAALVPLCGGGMYWNAERLKNMGIWAFHGIEDNDVLACESERMVERINLCGGNAKLTLYENTGHDCWTKTYSDRTVFEWLLNQRNKAADFKETDGYNSPELFG